MTQPEHPAGPDVAKPRKIGHLWYEWLHKDGKVVYPLRLVRRDPPEVPEGAVMRSG